MEYCIECFFNSIPFQKPNLVQFSDRIMKLLIETMEAKAELLSISRLTIRFYDALQSFCENFGTWFTFYWNNLE